MTKYKNNNELRHIKKKKTKNKTKKAKTKKVFTKPFVFFLILGSIAIAFYQVINHNVYKISSIEVTGNRKYKDQDIIAFLDNPIEKNIITYKTSEYENKLLEIDDIKNAKIEKEYPNILKVKIDEVYPMMYVSTNDGIYYINNESNIMDSSKVDQDMLKELIEVRGLKEINKSKKFTKDKKILEFIKQIQKYDFSTLITKLDFENRSDIGIMYSDIDVNFGSLENLDYKLKLLSTVIEDINQKNIKAKKIMLNQGDNPVVVVDNE
ncbi:MAG: FtsQ-type POTRA domain-containing protein [Tissierellia bacterium]|nr:FtsQ-type POTRA domain-containing protein [Tissierellia bacterium]